VIKGEFYAMCSLVNPGVFGTLSTFKRNFITPIVLSRDSNASQACIRLGKEKLDDLNKITKKFIIRRTADVNVKYLPKKSKWICC